MSDTMLREAVDAISKGQRMRARDLLTRLLRTDQANPDYWLWMSSVVETQHERIYCLESALKLDPTNTAARQGLILLGARKPGDEVKPVPPPRRSAQADIDELEVPRSGFQKMWAKPKLRLAFIGGVLVGLLALAAVIVIVGNAADRRQQIALMTANAPTATLRPFSTATEGPTPTLVVRSPTPTFRGATPLWMLLEATYTPVPLYVPTPETNYEAFRMAMRAYERSEYSKMLSFMLEASGYEPDSAILKYYAAEAYRLNDDYQNALVYYNQVIEEDEYFAAAYLGRARVERLVNEEAPTLDDLSQALELDSNMGEAYLERAAYFIEIGNTISATMDLDTAEGLVPYSPLLYLYRSQAALADGDTDGAVEYAEQAFEKDKTQLPIYLALAEAYMANGDYDKALDALDTYLVYVTDKPDGYMMKGRMYLEQDKYEEALKMFNTALELDPDRAEGYYFRGLTHMELGEGQEAVNDLVRAQQNDRMNFQINLDLGRALMIAERRVDARSQLDATAKLADTDLKLAAVYFYRALVFESLAATTSAGRDWRALLALESDEIPQEWRDTAQEHLDAIYPPTATLTATPAPATRTSTLTPTARAKTLTPTAARTPTKTP